MDASDSPNMIAARGLKRTYKTRGKTVDAVRGIDLTIRSGEIVGFLGPNGAGKTTTLKMLTTLLEPTDGEATIAGCDLRRDPRGVRRRIGYVAQGGSTAGIARAGLEITSQAELFGIPAKEARKRGEDLLTALDLEDVWDRRCESLSGGQRRRLDIVMGLIHRAQDRLSRRTLDRPRSAVARKPVAPHPQIARRFRHDGLFERPITWTKRTRSAIGC